MIRTPPRVHLQPTPTHSALFDPNVRGHVSTVQGRSMTHGVVLEVRRLSELDDIVDRLVRGVYGPSGESAEAGRPFEPGDSTILTGQHTRGPSQGPKMKPSDTWEHTRYLRTRH